MISQNVLNKLREMNPNGDFDQLMALVSEGDGASLPEPPVRRGVWGVPLPPSEGVSNFGETRAVSGISRYTHPAGLAEAQFAPAARGIGQFFNNLSPERLHGMANTYDDNIAKEGLKAFDESQKPVKSKRRVGKKEAMIAGGIAALLHFAGARNASSVLGNYFATKEGQAEQDEADMRADQQNALRRRQMELGLESNKSDRMHRYADLKFAVQKQMNDRDYAEHVRNQQWEREDFVREDAQSHAIGLAEARGTGQSPQEKFHAWLQVQDLSDPKIQLAIADKMRSLGLAKTEEQLRPIKVEGEKLGNQGQRLTNAGKETANKAARMKLDFLDDEQGQKRKEWERLAAAGEKARATGNSKAERASFAQRREILTQQKSITEKRIKAIAAQIKDHPALAPSFKAEMESLNKNLQQIRDAFTQMTQEAGFKIGNTQGAVNPMRPPESSSWLDNLVGGKYANGNTTIRP